MLFAEDITLGPEPLLWASPKRFGDPANTKVSDVVPAPATMVGVNQEQQTARCQADL